MAQAAQELTWPWSPTGIAHAVRSTDAGRSTAPVRTSDIALAVGLGCGSTTSPRPWSPLALAGETGSSGESHASARAGSAHASSITSNASAPARAFPSIRHPWRVIRIRTPCSRCAVDAAQVTDRHRRDVLGRTRRLYGSGLPELNADGVGSRQ